ncbi:unnamed protein product, partial [Polarella glacialis]
MEIAEDAVAFDDDKEDAPIKPHPRIIGRLHRSLHRLQHHCKQARAQHDDTHVQQEDLDTDFLQLCLATGCAWMTADAVYEVVCQCYLARGTARRDSLSHADLLVARVIVACILALLVPPLSLVVEQVRDINGLTRLSAFLKLLKKALPMTMGWAWKDLVAQLTVWTVHDKGIPAYVMRPVIALGITVYVASLMRMPCVKAAFNNNNINNKGAFTNNNINNNNNNNDDNNSSNKKGLSKAKLLDRYLCLPSSYMLAVGYSYNQSVQCLIQLLTGKMAAGLDEEIYAILNVIVQASYYSVVSLATVRITCWWAGREEGLHHEIDLLKQGNAGVKKRIADEVQVELGEVFVHGLAFVYAWALYDMLQCVYFPVLVSCASWQTCDFRKNFLFAVVVTIFSVITTWPEKSQQRKTKQGQTYQLLVTTALSLTCIWAWSNFYSTLQSTFISKWAQHYPSNDVVLVWHLFFTAVSWLFMSAL